MKSETYAYDAYRLTQTPDGTPLVLFAAPAVEIDQWVGIPQRSRLDGEETVGFQREENASRVDELAKFFKDDRNVVQNPLLAALQVPAQLKFTEEQPGSSFGKLTIICDNYSELPLIALMRQLVDRLEVRVPTLRDSAIDPQRMNELLERASERHDLMSVEETYDSSVDDEEQPASGNGSVDDIGDVANILLAEETQLVEFYNELRARILILEKLATGDPDEILGFSKGAILGYLKPVVLVDGQHRLRGAVEAAKRAFAQSDGGGLLMDAVDENLDPKVAEQKIVAAHSRRLPVSLLMNDSPSEHVFQFVVVNQKATPMGKALLGTIISTSLSLDELKPVAQRLQDAGIKLEDSRAIAYLTRHESSPFNGLVQTGVSGDKQGLLQWNVLSGLVGIFRDLRGGRLYHQNVDYAKAWADKFLLQSGLVEGETEAARREAWSQPDGPWREFFIVFYSRIRDEFGDANDMSAHNAWGNTASNLFNKVSLTILAADYFQFLFSRREPLVDLADVSRTLSDWLEDVNTAYFNRDWRLEGLKKDLPAIRSAWAKAWSEYRPYPVQLPDVRKFRGNVS